MSGGFKEIPGFPGYLICEDGFVYSEISNRFLAWGQNSKFYARVALWHNNRRQQVLLHRLVAILFVSNPDPINKTEVNHDDFDKMNPSASNLTWMTPLENRKYNRLRSWKISDPLTDKIPVPF